MRNKQQKGKKKGGTKPSEKKTEGRRNKVKKNKKKKLRRKDELGEEDIWAGDYSTSFNPNWVCNENQARNYCFGSGFVGHDVSTKSWMDHKVSWRDMYI